MEGAFNVQLSAFYAYSAMFGTFLKEEKKCRSLCEGLILWFYILPTDAEKKKSQCTEELIIFLTPNEYDFFLIIVTLQSFFFPQHKAAEEECYLRLYSLGLLIIDT